MNPETEQVFEELLFERGLVTPEQLSQAKEARAESEKSGQAPKPLTDILAEKGYCERALLEKAAQAAAVKSGSARVNIGGFELLERVGQGAMGAVYRARQVNIGRLVALKLMRPALARDKRYLERFLREARASARLSHPNIVQGIDAGQDKGYYYFAMEFVDGDSLRRIIAREGNLPEKRCIEIGIKMAGALAHAAKYSMIHRDIKPENILIEQETGEPKLADLGLAKSVGGEADTSVTQAGTTLGTPNYISPEQARGEETVDIRSDIYSLGATLYHASTATLPFEGETAPVVMSKHMAEPLDPPDRRNPALSAGFSRVIQKMMAKRREDRYQTPEELLEDLQRLASGEQPVAAIPAAEPAPRRPEAAEAAPRAGRKLVAAAVAAAVLAAVVFAVIELMPPGDTPDEEAAAARNHFSYAATMIAAQPANFPAIIDSLSKCIERDPKGPKAAAARELLVTATAFQNLVRGPAASPEQWTEKVKQLKKLAERAPTDPPYGPGILRFIKDSSRSMLAETIRSVVSDPVRAPGAVKWIDAVAKAEPDPEIAEEAARGRTELARIVAESADYFLDRFAQESTRASSEKDYKRAIDILRSGIPEELMSPQLRALADRKVTALREAAAAHMEELRASAWAALDGGDLGGAKSALSAARTRLDLPELRPRIESLAATLELAPAFLPLWAELSQLEAAENKDEHAAGQAALKIRDGFGSDPYNARRLEKYADLIARLVDTQQKEKALSDAAALVEQGRYEEAEAVIAKAVAAPDLPEPMRHKFAELRLGIPASNRLAMMLAAAMKDHLPVENVMLPAKGRVALVPAKITALVPGGFVAEMPDGQCEMQWKALGCRVLLALTTGQPRLLAEDNAEALYCLGAVLREENRDESKRLLQSAIAAAEKKTDAELHGRAALLARARELLSGIVDAEAEAALRQLAEMVAAVRGYDDIARSIAAYNAFKAQHGESRYARANTAVAEKICGEIADLLVRERSQLILPFIRDRSWRKMISVTETVLADTEKQFPLTQKSREAFEGMIEFGRDCIVEDTICRDVFRNCPWNGRRLKTLQSHQDQRIAERARRYGEIFDINVGARLSALKQLEYATREGSSENKTLRQVQDVNERLARYNAVFTYWPAERAVCKRAEIAAGRDFRETGGTGDLMTLLIMENFLSDRKGTDKSTRAAAELERVNCYVRAANRAPFLRAYAIQLAKDAMMEYREEGDYTARFCLIVAEQNAAAGNFGEAERYFDKLIDPRSSYKSYVWRGYLGRGRVRELRERYAAAADDYQAAFFRASDWGSSRTCAAALVNLCLHSGKLDKPESAKQIVAELVKRADSSWRVTEAKKLLEKDSP